MSSDPTLQWLIILWIASILFLVYLLYRVFRNGGFQDFLCKLNYHKWGNWEYVSQKSCEKKETCPNCKAVRGESKIDHQWEYTFIRPNDCYQLEICSHCGEQSGRNRTIHQWNEKFLEENSNVKVTQCIRCNEVSYRRVTQHAWPWLFSEGTCKSLFIHLQNCVEYHFNNSGIWIYDSTVGSINKYPQKVVKFIPETNFSMTGFGFGKANLFFEPDFFSYSIGNEVKFSCKYRETKFFVEKEIAPVYGAIPKAAKIMYYSWLYSRKDGGPDLRRKDNPRIPQIEFEKIIIPLNNNEHISIYSTNTDSHNQLVQVLSDYLKNIIWKDWNQFIYENESEKQQQKSREHNDGTKQKRQQEAPKQEAHKQSTHKEESHEEEKSREPHRKSINSLEEAYAILDIKPSASMDEIETAYRKKAKMNHTDRVSDMDPVFVELANERMKAINLAKELILKTKKN